MAIRKDPLVSTFSKGRRKQLAAYHEGTLVATFAPITNGPEVLRGTPVAFDTSVNKWKIWANAGINGVNIIKGFVYETFTSDGTDDVLAVVMVKGSILFDDIVLPDGETENNLKAALQTNMIERGLDIKELENIR